MPPRPLLQKLWLAGQFEDGIRHWNAIRRPSPKQKFWAAQCLLSTGQSDAAHPLFSHLLETGFPLAPLGTAQLSLAGGAGNQAAATLDAVDVPEPGTPEQALYLWVRGSVAHYAGDLVQACDLIERAWQVATGLGPRSSFTVALAQQLAGLFEIRGLSVKAAPLMQAALARQGGARRAHLLGLLALNRAYRGDLTGAAQTLTQASAAASRSPHLHATLAYERGVIARLSGDLHAAARAFQDASVQAAQLGEWETLRYAELYAAVVSAEQGDTLQAELHYARAAQYCDGDVFAQHLRFRRGTLDRPDLDALDATATFFETKQFMREASWAWLHLAEAQLGAGLDARPTLHRVQTACYLMGSAQSLQAELRLLPLVQAALTGRADDALGYLQQELAAPPPRDRYVFQTFGDLKLVKNGEHLAFRLARTLEVLAFVLHAQPVTMDRLLTTLFPDEAPQRARNYVHQTRHDLANVTRGLRIGYHPGTRSYSVETASADFEWDADHLRAQLGALADLDTADALAVLEQWPGPFLPTAGSQWATEERERYSAELFRSASQLLGRADRNGEWRVLQFLHSVDPFEDAVNAELIRATEKLHGRCAAHNMLARMLVKYDRELGVVPQVLQDLQRALAGS